MSRGVIPDGEEVQGQAEVEAWSVLPPGVAMELVGLPGDELEWRMKYLMEAGALLTSRRFIQCPKSRGAYGLRDFCLEEMGHPGPCRFDAYDYEGPAIA